MHFKDALKILKHGGKVKLPSWGGYWYWCNTQNTIMIHTKDDKIMDIRETQVVEYTLNNILSDKWIIADESNTPILGGEVLFDFDEALKYMKRDIRVKRKNWSNGILLKDNITVEDVMSKDWIFA